MSITEILSDPEASPWLKNALAGLLILKPTEALALISELNTAILDQVEAKNGRLFWSENKEPSN